MHPRAYRLVFPEPKPAKAPSVLRVRPVPPPPSGPGPSDQAALAFEPRELWVAAHVPRLPLAALQTTGGGAPRVVTDAEDRNQRIIAADPRAEAEGVRAGMTLGAALAVMPGDVVRDKYEDVEINPVKVVAEEPVSTFSIDVDTASYSNVRRMINQGYLPPKDAVRIEELINYFDYEYALPKSKNQPFETNVKIVPSPWAEGRQLMHVAIQGYDIERQARPPLNLTLLIDVSGSMSDQNRSGEQPWSRPAIPGSLPPPHRSGSHKKPAPSRDSSSSFPSIADRRRPWNSDRRISPASQPRFSGSAI